MTEPASSNYIRVNDDTDEFPTSGRFARPKPPYVFSTTRSIVFIALGFTAVVAIVVIAVFALKSHNNDPPPDNPPPPPPPPPPTVSYVAFTSPDVIWARTGTEIRHLVTVVGGTMTQFHLMSATGGPNPLTYLNVQVTNGKTYIVGTVIMPPGSTKFAYTQLQLMATNTADNLQYTQQLLIVAMVESVGYFFQFTDMHYKADQPPNCLSDATHRYKYGQNGCDSTLSLINATMMKAYEYLPDPDFIVITGDFAGHDNTDPYPLISAVKDVIDTNFPGLIGRIYASIGNNDVVPNYYIDESHPNVQLENLTRVFGDWLDPDWQESFLEGGYFSAQINSFGHRVIVLNTVYWSISHHPAPSDDPMNQMAWLITELERARQDRYRVLITAHVTPGFSSFNGATLMNETFQTQFVTLCQEYADVIAANIVGHEHEDIFHDMAVMPGAPALYLVGGAVSPVYHNNPGFRIFLYDTITLDIFDYLSISENMLQYQDLNWPYDFPVFNFHYSPLLSYGIHGANSTQWLEFVTQLEQSSAPGSTNNSTYVSFLDHIWQGFPGPSLNRNTVICSLTAVTSAEMSSCLSSLQNNAG